MDTTPRYRLGLVLSGGGARGFAHIGVVQAMYEAGLRPDIISGTSAGSIVGAMIAAGHTPEECLNFFLGKKILHFARPTMSKKGIMIMNGMEERLAEFLHVKTFEELKIPLVITASDINGAVPVHFEKGELLPCIIASCSIPVVFTPREIDHVDYVDGGVFMNLRRNQFDRYFGKNHQHDRYGYPFFSSGSGPEYRYRPEYVRCIHIPPKYDQIQHVRSGTHQRDL